MFQTWFLSLGKGSSRALLQILIMLVGLWCICRAAMKNNRRMEKVLKLPDGPAFLDALEALLQDKHDTRPREMSQQELGFLAVRQLEAEVNNGGFDQYFFNSAGSYASDALWGLHAIGAGVSASILERAMAQFPDGQVPDLRSDRHRVMEDLPESTGAVWDGLDQEFYASREDIDGMLLRFVRENEREFR